MDFFHGAFKGIPSRPGRIVNTPNLGFGNFKGIHAALTNAALVYCQHDGRGFFGCFVENTAQNRNHKLHARVIVVVQQNPVAIRLLKFFFPQLRGFHRQFDYPE